ncbi:hypothetical protein ACFU9F_31370 [Streptomyces zhihengii]|uniref:hypothetical protein n=1 Tax=Streptomyces zhihengii TaxID=1818004 RepID=UPI00368F66BE
MSLIENPGQLRRAMVRLCEEDRQPSLSAPQSAPEWASRAGDACPRTSWARS